MTVPLRSGARIVIQEGGNVGHPAGWLAERYATEEAAAGETLIDGAAELVPVVRAVIAEKVINRYDEVVRSNTTDDYDAVRAVAYDDDGIWGVHGEVIDVAGEMGRFVDDDGTLSAATSRYQARLRAELDGDVLDRIAAIVRKPDWSGADDLAALAELVAETGRDVAGPAGAEGVPA